MKVKNMYKKLMMLVTFASLIQASESDSNKNTKEDSTSPKVAATMVVGSIESRCAVIDLLSDRLDLIEKTLKNLREGVETVQGAEHIAKESRDSFIGQCNVRITKLETEKADIVTSLGLARDGLKKQTESNN